MNELQTTLDKVAEAPGERTREMLGQDFAKQLTALIDDYSAKLAADCGVNIHIHIHGGQEKN